MQVPGKLTTGTAAGGGVALLLAAKLTILTMWLLGISDADAPFDVIDAATTVITAFWSVMLTVIGGVIAHFIPTQPKEDSDAVPYSTTGADHAALPAGDASAAGDAAADGLRDKSH